MAITASAHVVDIVTEAPATIAVFQRHHIEFCCAGHIPLQVVCEHEGLDVASLIEELTVATQPFFEADDWHHAPLDALVFHIQAAYHQPLYEELPRLGAMLEKVAQRHGDRFPETLRPLRSTFIDLERDLLFHMRREDALLFPAIVRLASQADVRITGPHPLLGPVAAMEQEHADVDHALTTLRSLTTGYQPPPDACPTFRGLYYGLRDLDHRMRVHMHLEDDILFPGSLTLGRSGDASGVEVV